MRIVLGPRPFLAFVPVLLLPLLIGSAGSSPATSASSGLSDVDTVARSYAEAAAAVRRKDCDRALRLLDPLVSAGGAQAPRARLTTGLYAHACEQVGLAEERLFAAKDAGGALEDWRLYILADSAAARGHVLLAQAALAKLVGDFPRSPLRPRAMVKAANLAWQREDGRRALAVVEQARGEGLRGEAAAALESLAWEIGNRWGDAAVRAAAARQLLADSPTQAANLQVAEIFRLPDGSFDWASALDAGQLERRARSLLALDLTSSAVSALDAVRPGDRDLAWSLLKAEVLTRGKNGLAALGLLAPLTAADARGAVDLEWGRAMAAEDAATARGGAGALSAAERAELKQISRRHLRKVVQLGTDRELAARALRLLYTDSAEDDFEQALAALRQLRRLDSADTTGAANLWERGWQEYGRSNFSGAVGYWTELFALYPENSHARRGRYWTGRAFQALGESERAQQIYREVAAADTDDFYRRNALVRLRGGVATAASVPAEPWPVDPVLERARLLSDLGLEALARTEMELVKDRAEKRSLAALEALILAREGDRRKSVVAIREAFPALGGPFQAAVPAEALKLYYPLEYQDTVRTWAKANYLPPHLVFGIIRQESAFDTQAQSWAGARGLMQLMPATARELAGKIGLSYSHSRLSDPEFNLQLGTTYFRQVLGMFDGNLELALAGYNGGPNRIKRLWRETGTKELDSFLESLRIEESKTYVKRILVLSDSYRQLYPKG